MHAGWKHPQGTQTHGQDGKVLFSGQYVLAFPCPALRPVPTCKGGGNLGLLGALRWSWGPTLSLGQAKIRGGGSVPSLLFPASTSSFVFFRRQEPFSLSPFFAYSFTPTLKAELNSNLNCEACPEHDRDSSHTSLFLHVFLNTSQDFTTYCLFHVCTSRCPSPGPAEPGDQPVVSSELARPGRAGLDGCFLALGYLNRLFGRDRRSLMS